MGIEPVRIIEPAQLHALGAHRAAWIVEGLAVEMRRCIEPVRYHATASSPASSPPSG